MSHNSTKMYDEDDDVKNIGAESLKSPMIIPPLHLILLLLPTEIETVILLILITYIQLNNNKIYRIKILTTIATQI